MSKPMAPTGDTMYSLGELFRRSCETYANKPALLVHQNDNYVPITYSELEQRVRSYCQALTELGLVTGDRVAIMSENCMEWAITDWACQCLGIVLVPIYPTLPADQAQYIVTNCGAKLAIHGSDQLAARLQGVPDVRLVPLKDGTDSISALVTNREMDRTEWQRRIAEVDPYSLATLIYTSGTTGNPKGVMLPHKCFTWLCNEITDTLPITSTDTFFSFLPLSHIFERFAGHVLPIHCGATIAYSRGVATLANDIGLAKPTVVLAVPRFLEAMKDRISDRVAKESGLKQKLFHAALGQGLARYKRKFAPLAVILDAVVCKKIRNRFGGQIRFFVSGGAALPSHLSDFYNAIGLPILQGYGLTESTAGTTLNSPDDSRPWTVGRPIGRIEVQIASDGEIILRAPSIMDGYYNLPDDTAAALDSEGWFHTGDIGTMEDGFLRITDRKKDLLVLANGKNVAPQPIEDKFREIAYISDVVLFGDGCEYVYGLVIPHFERLEAHVQGLGIKPPPHDELLKLDPIKKLIKSEIDKVNKGLADFERMKKYVLVNAVFSIETGELTPSMKVKRKFVREKYSDALQSIQ